MLKRKPFNRKGGTLKRKRFVPKRKTEEQLEEMRADSRKMLAFWQFVEQNTNGISEISRIRLPSNNKGTMHHLFEKSKYPELKYSLGNILRITLDEHQNLNRDPDYYEVAQQRRASILDNWCNFVEESLNWELQYEQRMNKEV